MRPRGLMIAAAAAHLVARPAAAQSSTPAGAAATPSSATSASPAPPAPSPSPAAPAGSPLPSPAPPGSAAPAPPVTPSGSASPSAAGQRDCPGADAIRAAVIDLLAKTSPPGTPDVTRDASIIVDDQGDHYTVTVDGHARAYADDARDCAERVRVAAVFVALTLAPPTIDLPPPPAPPPPPPALPPKSPTHEVRIEGAAAALMAPSTQSPLTFGGTLHASWELGAWGVVLGVTGAAPWSWQVGPARVRVVRVPVDLDLRVVLRVKSLALAAEGGPLVAWVDIAGRDMPAPASSTRWQGGGRLAAIVRADIGTFSPYATVWGEWAAPRVPIAVVPDGVVGSLPPFWVGVALGVGARLR